MSKNKKYDYSKAEADLYDAGARHPDEIYEYHTDKGFRSHMKEHGLNPDKYVKPDKSKKSSSSGSSGCYLTTACVVARGLPDDCNELQTLRAFRDTFLASLPDGQNEINQYYRMAPDIVSSIDQRENRDEIWNQVYDELIAPCVRMIQADKNDAAYRLYKRYSLKLHNDYCN